MPNEGKYQPIVLKDFSGGWVTTREADDLNPNESPDLQNIDFDGRGSFQIRKGYELAGNRDTAAGSVARTHVFQRAILGDEIPVRQVSASLEYYHTGTEEWETIKFTGTSTGTFGFADFAATTDTVDYMYMCDGVVNLQRWTGGHTLLNGALSGGEATIPVDSTTGFSSSGTIYIGTTEVTYSGKDATNFTGCSGTPVASDDDPVSEKAIDFAAAAGTKPVGNIMTVTNRQLAVVEDQSVIISDTNDFTTWTGGNSDEFAIGYKITALSSKDDSLIVFSENAIYDVTYQYTSDLTGFQIDSKILEDTPGYGAKVFTGITRADGQIYYVGSDNILRRIVRSPVSALLDTGSISENIRDTLKDYTLDSATAIFYENKLYFSVQSDESNINDTVLVYDLKFARANESGEAWSKYSMFVSDFYVYGNALYFGSSAEPNCFRCFTDSNNADILLDDGAAITWYYKTPQFDFDTPYKRFRMKKFISRGFISANSDITYVSDYDYGTVSEQELSLVGSNEEWVYVPSGSGVLGEEVIGEDDTGGAVDPFKGVYPFNFVESWGTVNFYNSQLTVGGQTKSEQYKQTRLILYVSPQDDIMTN
jgi:hypothetical protein